MSAVPVVSCEAKGMAVSLYSSCIWDGERAVGHSVGREVVLVHPLVAQCLQLGAVGVYRVVEVRSEADHRQHEHDDGSTAGRSDAECRTTNERATAQREEGHETKMTRRRRRNWRKEARGRSEERSSQETKRDPT